MLPHRALPTLGLDVSRGVVSSLLGRAREPMQSGGIVVEELRDEIVGYCADLSTSMKFGTDVDQIILN